MSAMNTFFTQLEQFNESQIMNTFLLGVAVSFRYNSLLPSFPGSPRAQATESWAEPAPESLEDAVYNKTVYSVFMKNF